MNRTRVSFLLAGTLLVASGIWLAIGIACNSDMRWLGYIALPGSILWAGSATAVYFYQRHVQLRGRNGVTLIELIVVMSIIALLSIVALGSMHAMATQNAREGAITALQTFLRVARMRATQSGQGVQVLWAGGGCVVNDYRLIAAWHLEADTKGARGIDAVLQDDGQPVTITDGAIGLCYQFNWDGGSLPPSYSQSWDQYIESPNVPIFEQREGLAFGIWVRWDYNRTDGAEVILAGRNGWALRCDPGGRVYAELVTDDGSYTTAAYRLEHGEWTHVELRYNNITLGLLVNGVERESVIARGLVERGGALLMGQKLLGCLDEPRFYAGGSRHWQKPAGAQIWVSEPLWVWDRQGQLDIAYHAGGPVRLALGDPYQKALLAEAVAGAGTEARLAKSSMFPAQGGIVLIDGIPIAYGACDGDMLTGLTGIPVGGFPADAEVQWARILRVANNGIASREQ